MPTAYTNLFGTGPRCAPSGGLVQVSTNSILTGSLNGLVDGNTTSNTTTNSCFFTSSTSNVGLYFQFNFPRAVVMDEITLYMSAATSQGDWKVQGSNDNWTTPVDLTASFTWNTATQVQALTNSTAYTSYRLIGVSGNTNNGPWIREFEFKVDAPTAYERGNRTSIITATSSITFGSGTAPDLVDGQELTGAGNAVWKNSLAVTGQDITFDFGAASIVVNGFAWLADSNSDAWGSWKMQGWNGASWEDIAGATFTIGGLTSGGRPVNQVFTWTNTTGYVKYRMLGTAGTTAAGGNWQEEAFFLTAAALLLPPHAFGSVVS